MDAKRAYWWASHCDNARYTDGETVVLDRWGRPAAWGVAMLLGTAPAKPAGV